MTAMAQPVSFAPAARRAWRVLTRPHVILGIIDSGKVPNDAVCVSQHSIN